MDRKKSLYLLGISFREAPVEVREALHFNPDDARDFLGAAIRAIPDLEACLISTCNRTELYLAAMPEANAPFKVLEMLKHWRPHPPTLTTSIGRYSLSNIAAVRHLFRVTTGLDSAILGDGQILGQVKEAMAVASSVGAVGAMLNETCVLAIQAGKKARSETKIGYGAASIGSAITSTLIEQEVELRRAMIVPRVLVIGAGEIARDISRHISKSRTRNISFINRTHEKAVEMADDCGGRARHWKDLATAVQEHHFVIAATACSTPLLTRKLLSKIYDQHSGKACLKLIFDAGVPRNAESGLPVRTIDIDAIRERQELSLQLRRQAIGDVEKIIETSLIKWERWQHQLPVENLIHDLYSEVEVFSRQTAHQLYNAEIIPVAQLECFIQSRLKRMLRKHARNLRQLQFPTREIEAAGRNEKQDHAVAC